jgi:tight adherence protein C
MLLAESLFISSVFGSVGSLAWLLLDRLANREGVKITARLSDASSRDARKELEKGPPKSLLKRLGTLAGRVFMADGESQRISGLRAKLAMAGIYDPSAIRSIIGFKFICLVVGLFVGFLTIGTMGAAFGGLIGYLAPQMWLSSKIRENQKQLDHGIPDALDLMVICVESGLTVDGTMQRVGEELSFAQPAISREFGICHTETRLGVARQQAFKNLATRTGNTNLKGLTAMLIQADRFGTSVAHALRVQAEAMRTKRQFAAEELAGKASVKMSFPLVLFIFPATFLVMMGPMIVQFVKDGFL